LRIDDQRGFVTGGIFAILGASIAIGASSYEIGSAAQMGPGYFPRAIGLLLALVGTAVLGSSLKAGSVRVRLEAWPMRGLSIVVSAIVLFALLVDSMGLLIAIPMLVGLSALAHPEFSWARTLTSIVVLLLLVLGIFVLLLKLQFRVLPSFLQS
jgi:Tripartite tricarboxylate transporter TctB family